MEPVKESYLRENLVQELRHQLGKAIAVPARGNQTHDCLLVDPTEEIPSADGLIDINIPDLVSSTDIGRPAALLQQTKSNPPSDKG